MLAREGSNKGVARYRLWNGRVEARRMCYLSKEIAAAGLLASGSASQCRHAFGIGWAAACMVGFRDSATAPRRSSCLTAFR
jgi:hypothetical protein